MTRIIRSRFARPLRFATALTLAVGQVSGLLPAFGVSAHAADRVAVAAALNSIRAPELKRHVEVLADDAFEGREAGTRGGRAAGGYLAERFQQAGLAGRGDDGGYFQTFGNGSRNLLGFLEGSDPTLKQEIIVVGAHYDHVGYGSRRNSLGPIGYIHNGADDNASGTAGLLEMIDAFKLLGAPPRRSILFAFWDGEEAGLLGSKHWVANPTVPLKQVVFALNTDMIGRLRNQRVELLGTRSAPGLRQLAARANAPFDFDLDFTWEMKPNSDHYSFFARQIPVLMLHTGLHDDYHRPSDDVEKVNAEGMESLSRYWFQIALELAEAEERSNFRAESQHENPAGRKQMESAIAPPGPRLGVSFRQIADPPCIELTVVDPESPGGRAGLKVGDRLLKINDAPLHDENEFRLQVLGAASPAKFTVLRAPEMEPVEIDVKLAGNPSRVGIWWREDAAEPHTVLVNLVIPGSAAAQAGLQVGDRLYSLNGQPIDDGAALRAALTTQPGPFTFEAERNGRWRTITVKPLPLRERL